MQAAQQELGLFASQSKIDEAFWQFHKKNPQVFARLLAMTREARRQGKRRIGMKMLFEVIRWEHMLSTKHDDFALNNNYTSRYVRLIEELDPELGKMFEKRTIRS